MATPASDARNAMALRWALRHRQKSEDSVWAGALGRTRRTRMLDHSARCSPRQCGATLHRNILESLRVAVLIWSLFGACPCLRPGLRGVAAEVVHQSSQQNRSLHQNRSLETFPGAGRAENIWAGVCLRLTDFDRSRHESQTRNRRNVGGGWDNSGPGPRYATR